jgi:CRP/FNR family transcriptional regulator, cyclic AMP receptor protein
LDTCTTQTAWASPGHLTFGERNRHTVGVAQLASDPELLNDALRRDGHVRHFRRGQALFTEGDRAERVFLIESGWVLISCTSPEGREIVLGIRGSGEIIGEMSTLDGEARSATAVAIGDVEATISAGTTLTRALDDAAAARGLIQILAWRLRDADRTRIQFATLDTLGRVAERLLELSDRFGQDTDDGLAVELPLSQEQLASWCGASRESTVKALSTLRSLSCITTGRQTVVIHDLAALRGHARRRSSG